MYCLIVLVCGFVSSTGALPANSSLSAVFFRHETIVGKTCSGDASFSTAKVSSVSRCATMCLMDDSCKSYFYSKQTSRCDGCTSVHQDDSSLMGFMEGSAYYAESRCHVGWVKREKSCFYFSKTNGEYRRNWTDAWIRCEELGSHLVEIHDVHTNEFIVDEMEESVVWMAYTDHVIEGDWWWRWSKTRASYTNWTPGQPSNNELQDCSALVATSSGQWRDDPCGADKYFACEQRIPDVQIKFH